jgi:hypothetical protein
MSIGKFVAYKWRQILVCIFTSLVTIFILTTSDYKCQEYQGEYEVNCQPSPLLQNYTCNWTALNANLESSEWEIYLTCPWSSQTYYITLITVAMNFAYVSLILNLKEKQMEKVPVWIFVIGIFGGITMLFALGFMISDFNSGNVEWPEFYKQFNSQLYKITPITSHYQLLIVFGFLGLIPIGISIYNNSKNLEKPEKLDISLAKEEQSFNDSNYQIMSSKKLHE